MVFNLLKEKEEEWCMHRIGIGSGLAATSVRTASRQHLPSTSLLFHTSLPCLAPSSPVRRYQAVYYGINRTFKDQRTRNIDGKTGKYPGDSPDPKSSATANECAASTTSSPSSIPLYNAKRKNKIFYLPNNQNPNRQNPTKTGGTPKAPKRVTTFPRPIPWEFKCRGRSC